MATLIKEISYRHNYLQNKPVSTIYFGGGTPSLLSIAQLSSILDALHVHFTFSTELEITLEVNPENVTIDYLKALTSLGINRISMGVQSFLEDELVFMNRSHNAHQSLQSIEHLSTYFTNYSIDFIFGSHLQNINNLHSNLLLLTKFSPPHISCYALTIEEKTVLANKIKNNKLLEPSQTLQAEYFYFIKQFLEADIYSHYEISNYAKKGFESKHNSNYWKGIHYLGLGPSAHSFNTYSRSWNISNTSLYIQSSDNFINTITTETLTSKEQINEFLMIGLRTQKGIHLPTLQSITTTEQYYNILRKVLLYVQDNKIVLTNTAFTLSTNGLIFADGIAADLFVD